MECPKCKGLMVPEEFSDPSNRKFPGWRCVNCGTVIMISFGKSDGDKDSRRGPKLFAKEKKRKKT